MTTASTEMMVRPQQDDALMAMPLLSIDQMIQRRDVIVQAVKRKVLVKGQDYGVIPGTERKNTGGGGAGDDTPSSKNNVLLKPGAEKLCSFFGLVPEFEDYRVTEDWETGLFYYAYRCLLTRNGRTVASGIGSANSREKKYRRGARACPECGAPTIRRSKYPPKNAPKGTVPGWYCYEKDGGCGRQFDADDKAILESGPTSDPNASCDLINTLQKMAQKRALVAATLIATNASEFFTQDLEDSDDGGDERGKPQANGRQVLNEETGEVMEGEAPDYTNDMVFMGAWHETLKNRGWTAEEADAAIKGKLDKEKLSLGQVNLATRRGMLAKANNGKFDPFRDAIRAKAKQQEQGGGEAKAAEKAEQKSAPANGKQAGSVKPAEAEKEVESYETFLRLAREAAGDQIDNEVFERGIGQALMRVSKKGKGETTSKPWRAQQLAAIRAGAFDWSTGAINQVANAIA